MLFLLEPIDELNCHQTVTRMQVTQFRIVASMRLEIGCLVAGYTDDHMKCFSMCGVAGMTITSCRECPGSQ